MVHLLCRNKVADFERWHEVFVSHRDAHQKAGLWLEQLWRDANDPENVFFLFRVDDVGRAITFMSTPDAEAAAAESGVVNGEYHFLNEAGVTASDAP